MRDLFWVRALSYEGHSAFAYLCKQEQTDGILQQELELKSLNNLIVPTVLGRAKSFPEFDGIALYIKLVEDKEQGLKWPGPAFTSHSRQRHGASSTDNLGIFDVIDFLKKSCAF